MILLLNSFTGYAQKNLGCGRFIKPVTHAYPVGPQIYSDRFNNNYSEEELEEQTAGKGFANCTSGYFHLIFSDYVPKSGLPVAFTQAEKDIICQVFSDISNLVVAKNPDTKVVIKITKNQIPTGTNPSDNSDVEIAAIGSGIYENKCGIENTDAMKVITTGLPYGKRNHGYIILNKDITNWYTGTSLPIPSGKYDLFTIVYHEAMHILGMGSNIKESGFFHTTWDYYLKSDNPTGVSLLDYNSKGKCCDEHILNSKFLPINFSNIGCKTNQGVYFQTNTKVPLALLSYTGSQAEALSHLCTDKVDYLMGLDFPLGQRRTITDEEKSILCTLGYSTTACKGSECNPVAVQTGPFIVKPGGKIILGLKDLVLNTSPNATLSTIPMTSSLALTTSIINNEIVCLAGTKVGQYPLKYTVQGCSQERLCDEGEVMIVITDVIEKNCGNDNCELLYENFEKFNNHEEIRYFLSAKRNGFAYDYVTPFAENSADLLNSKATVATTWYCSSKNDKILTPSNDATQTGSKFLGIAVRNIDYENLPEGVTFPLCKPIQPGQTAEVSFFAAAYKDCTESNIELNFMASKPLSSYDIHTKPTVKIGPIYVPLPTANLSPAPSGATTMNNVKFVKYTQVITNNTSENLNYLSLSTFTKTPHSIAGIGTNYGYVYIDEVSAKLQEPCVIIPPTGTFSTCITDTPDPKKDLIWGKPNTTTKFSSLGVSPNGTWNTVTVYGQLILDQDVSFLDKTFYMEEGSEIVVQQNFFAHFNSCYLQGCKTMWKGINVPDAAYLGMTNSDIRDAHWAIKASGNGIYLDHNTFANNYYGIYLDKYYNFQSYFINNTFRGEGQLLPYYNGQTKDPTMYNSGQISYCGIYMKNSYYSVGDFADNNNINKFNQLQNGIIAYGGHLSAYYCEMLNIGGGLKGPFIFDRAISMSGTRGDVIDCDFQNCPQAISSGGGIGGYLSFLRNKITDCTTYGISVSHTEETKVEILGNIIKVSDKSKMYFAIQLREIMPTDPDNPTGTYTKVNDNDITTGEQYTDGIRILDCSSYVPGLVFDNVISPASTKQTDAGRGIYLNNATYFQIDSNGISGRYNGIVLEQSEGNLVRKNQVGNVIDKIDIFNGIWGYNSPYNLYCCNHIENKENAMHFSGICIYGNGIKSNTLQNYTVGMLYDEGSYTGTQFNTGNDFDFSTAAGTPSTGIAIDAQHDDPNPTVVSQSLFTCDPLQIPDVVFSANSDWFKDNKGLVFCEDGNGCKNTAWFPTFTDTTIVRKEMLKTNGTTTQWEGEQYLYNMISRNPEAITENQLLTTFYKEQSESDLGLLYAVRQQMINGIGNTTFNAELKSIDEKLASFMVLTKTLEDKKIKANSNEKDAIAEQITAIRGDIATLLLQYEKMQNSIEEAEKIKWTAIVNQNANISPKILAAQRLQKTNDYVAKYHLQNNSLTQEQLASLYTVALECPRTSGSAVFTARALYEYAQNIVVNWKPIDQCKKGESIPIDTKVSKNNIGATIYPNPTDGELHIEIIGIKDFTGEVILYNLQGQVVYQQAIGVNNIIDIQTIPQGVYIVKILNNKEVVQTEKLTIIK